VVLVVEESEQLRRRIGSTLRRDGHQVNELSDGVQLLARLTSLVALSGVRRDAIVIVATAARSVLPVLQMLRAARWRTPLVLLSEGSVPGEEAGLDAIATLARPLDLDALRSVVAAADCP
jgi:DNA-binding response OmpR family regulator